jgi:hypothetical protein
MKKRDTVTALCWVVLGFAISIWSATFPLGHRRSVGPGILPLACGLILILLGSVLFFQARKINEDKLMDTLAPLIPCGEAFTRVALSLGGMVLSAVVLDLFGFAITIFCLILFLFRSIEPQKWGVDIFYTLVFTIGSYVLFQLLLKVTLPHGFLGF